jgi:hypothetical protein
MMQMLRKGILGLALVALSGTPALAAPITVDEILYDSSANVAHLSGTVDMSLLGNVLTIVLTNTSANAAGSGAGILLTGIGFHLPTGVSIASGSVNMGTSTAVGFTKPATGDVSKEWGYDNNPLNSGMFQGGAALSYNTAVASMVSMTTHQFASGSISQPPGLGGPDFGLISANETDSLGNGVEGIRSSVMIQLILNGTVPSNLISTINAGNVGLSFGSPNATNQVPEPASLSLLAGGLFALGVVARRRRKR